MCVNTRPRGDSDGCVRSPLACSPLQFSAVSRAFPQSCLLQGWLLGCRLPSCWTLMLRVPILQYLSPKKQQFSFLNFHLCLPANTITSVDPWYRIRIKFRKRKFTVESIYYKIRFYPLGNLQFTRMSPILVKAMIISL